MNKSSTGFDVMDVSVDLIRSLRPVIEVVVGHDGELAKQLRKAASSVPLNISEGNRRGGKDRRYLWRVAAGSVAETRACLLVAEAWGYIEPDGVEASLELIDRIAAMLWRLTR